MALHIVSHFEEVTIFYIGTRLCLERIRKIQPIISPLYELFLETLG